MKCRDSPRSTYPQTYCTPSTPSLQASSPTPGFPPSPLYDVALPRIPLLARLLLPHSSGPLGFLLSHSAGSAPLTTHQVNMLPQPLAPATWMHFSIRQPGLLWLLPLIHLAATLDRHGMTRPAPPAPGPHPRPWPPLHSGAMCWMAGGC